MICKICTGFVEQGHENCPHCGSPLDSQSANKQKQRYYCKRCYRFLPSRICPIHGTEATIEIDRESLKSEAKPLGGKDVPKEPASPDPIVIPSAQNGSLSSEESPPDDDLFLNKILDDVLKESDDLKTEEFSTKQSKPYISSPDNKEPEKDLADSLLGGLIEEKFQTLKKERENQPRPSSEEEKKSYSTTIKSPPPRRKPAPSPKSPNASQDILASVKNNSSRKLIGLAVLVGILLIAVVGIGVKYYLKPRLDRAALLQQAEENFQQQNYSAAFQLYTQFEDQFPSAPEINTVKKRIASISSILEEQRKKLVLLQSLEEQALQAFEAGQILAPEENSVLSYLNQMLQIDPAYGPALELEEQVIEYLLSEAERAFNESRYDDALEKYKQILTLKPDDTQLLDEIEKTLKLKNIQEMLQNLSALSKTREELKNLQQERIRLQAQLKRERNRFQQLTKQRKTNNLASTTTPRKTSKTTRSTTQKPESPSKPLVEKTNTPPSTRSQSTTSAKKTPTTSASQNQAVENLLGIELLPSEENTATSQQPPVIDEKLIDGGEKQYIHKETPRLPPSIKKGDMLMILAECVVSVKGNVESVKLLTPLDDERINQVALNALKNYRFKPATFRGKPVRFKTVEVMTF